MTNYDLSTDSRDNLHLLLSTAKDELTKYFYCLEKRLRCEENVEKERYNMSGGNMLKLFFIFVLIYIVLIFLFESYWFFAVLVFPICSAYLIKTYFIAKANFIDYEAQLPDLEKKEADAKNNLDAIWSIPYDFRNEYALTKMLKFVENKQASNWERVTYLYEEHLHRMKMEDNAQQTLDEMKRQTDEMKRQSDDINRGANAAASAATAAWTNLLIK